MAKVSVGQRVVRSSTWTWQDQDGGLGHVGTVVRVANDPSLGMGLGTPKGWARIRWDNGYGNNYQVGVKDCFDLLLLDNAPAGVTHSSIICDGCGQDPVAGMRWKCASCGNYDLCTVCYMNDKHDLTHIFIRFSCSSETGIQITPRFGETKTPAKGLFPEATVQRAGDGQEKKSSGVEGQVLKVKPWEGRQRSAVTVQWSEGDASDHKVGYDGQVELKYIKPTTGIAYYSQHLPLLGKPLGLQTGDNVAMTLDAETLQAMQATGGLEWQSGMRDMFAKVGKVSAVTSRGNVQVTYKDGKSFTLHPDALCKVLRLGKGDRVRITGDLMLAISLQENSRNGWVEGMDKCLGMEGDVTNVDTHFDARVKLVGFSKAWSWHPCTLTLIKKNSPDDDPLIETDNDSSDLILKALMAALKTGEDSGTGSEDELGMAAKLGNLTRVMEIISVTPEEANKKHGETKKSALHRAAAQGHLEIVQALIGAGAEIEIQDKTGNTPLHYAVEGDEPAIAKYLIEKGANVNRANNNGRRAIHFAAYKGHVDCARILIKQDCDVNFKDNDGDTPIHDAIIKDREDVIELLLEVPNIDLTLRNKRELTALELTAYCDRPEAARLIVIANQKAILVPRADGHTVLHIAAVNNHIKTMRAILSCKEHAGLDLNAKNEIGLTALHLAATKGQTDCIEYLLAQGADINLQNHDGHSALHLAASARAKDEDKFKDTPTLQKIRKRYNGEGGVTDVGAALLCFMVTNGAPIDVENKQCRTPLSYVKDTVLKRTLKNLSRKQRADETSSWEDLANDEDVRAGQLSGKKDNHEDTDHLMDNNCSANPGTCEASTPVKSKIEVFDLVHKIDVKDLDLGPVIGSGQFGIVHRAAWRGTPVAVKKICITGSKKDEVEKEVSIHRQASHPNIVQMMALGYKDQDAFLVMQLIEGNSLSNIIFPETDAKVTLSRLQKLQVAREILQAVTFMHACNILHLDIKPANILVETLTTRPYLCDLGLAHIKNRNLMSQSSMNMRGTPCYMPPEALGPPDQGKRHTPKHDVWSVAGTLTELFAMQRLWGDSMHPFALLALMMTGKMGKPTALTNVEAGVRQILQPCFEAEPVNRPSAHQLLDRFNKLT